MAPRSNQSGKGGADQVDANVQAEQEKGYRGTVPDPHPNEAYSLQTGPDSPTAVPDDATRAAVPAPIEEG